MIVQIYIGPAGIIMGVDDEDEFDEYRPRPRLKHKMRGR